MKRLLTLLLTVLTPLVLYAGTTEFLSPGLSGTIAGDSVFTGTLDIDSNGVRLDSDGDGMLIMTGLGNGSDEDLRLNLDDTSNTGVFTSTTSLATLNFSSIALQESGIAVLNNDEIDASSELLAIMDDETGSGLLVFGTTPTITTAVITVSTTAAITASTTQTQGQGALTTNVNEISVCANPNDTVTAPAAAAGYQLTIINNGAQTLQVFPASGDNLGAGVDTAVTIAAGSNRVYTAFNTTNWEVTGFSL